MNMDNYKFLCGQCNNGYKNKSSLRSHINSVHNNRRYVCGHCHKEYIRNVDYIKHISKFYQPLILKQDKNNIEVSNAPTHAQKQPATSHTPNHNINITTAVMTNSTDWEKILQKDLELSSDEDEPPIKVSIGTLTEVTAQPDKNKSSNTSPLGILDLEPPKFVTTHHLPTEAKTIFKIKSRPTTHIGCVPIIVNKNSETQTDTNHCSACSHEEHLLIQ